jgi:hypothetical protein
MSVSANTYLGDGPADDQGADENVCRGLQSSNRQKMQED